MSSIIRSELREKNNVGPQPELKGIILPKMKDIGKNHVDWSSIVESEVLPIDLLLVTAIDTEFVNCYVYLGENTKRSWCHGLGYVDFGDFGKPVKFSNKVKVALIFCQDDNPTTVVKNAIEYLGPKAVVCVGCCGLMNPDTVKLGDIVISKKLATYPNKKINIPVGKNMATLIPYAKHGWEQPIQESSDFEVHREGTILSGLESIESLERRKKLLELFPEALATEMEGKGVYEAAYNAGIEWVVIKGISDLADGTQTETRNWQPFASAMAASLVHHMFKYPDVMHYWPHYARVHPRVHDANTREYTDNDVHFFRQYYDRIIQIFYNLF